MAPARSVTVVGRGFGGEGRPGMTPSDLLADAFGRIRGIVHEVVGGLSKEQLAFRPDGEANSIAWLVWHLTRIQDDHVASAAQTSQAWTGAFWRRRPKCATSPWG